MPPLIYDANAKVQPEIDPKMIVLVRRVRVRPTLIFQGRVEGVGRRCPHAGAASAAAASASKPAAPASDSLWIASVTSSQTVVQRLLTEVLTKFAEFSSRCAECALSS